MALATRCPSCETVFRISTAQAAAKGGMVRCGVCRNVFNSLDALVRVEELDVVEEMVVGHDDATGDAADDGAASRASDDDAATFDGPADRIEPGFVDERPLTNAWWLPETDLQRPTPDEGATGGRTAIGAAPLATAAMMLSDRRGDIAPQPTALGSTNPVFMRADADVEPPSAALHWIMALLTLAAALGLVGQLAYFWRDELAARWPPARPWLAAACERIGCAVEYPVHVASITIESASVQTTTQGPNVYVMTALLRNRDAVDLRFPHLQLVLTDLQDQPILRRDLRPEDYLPTGRKGPAGFPAGSELPIRVVFELNNLRFAGYRINQFYP